MKRFHSLKVKTTLCILIAVLLLTALSVTVSYYTYANTMDEQYKTNTMNIAKTAASQIDKTVLSEMMKAEEAAEKAALAAKPADVSEETYVASDEYLSYFKDIEKIEGYDKMLTTLREIQDNSDVESIYVENVDTKKKAVVYLLDASVTDRYQSGITHAVAKSNYGQMSVAALKESGFPAFITNNWGWLCTAGAMALDDGGTKAAVVCVDVSMNAVMQDRYRFLKDVLLLLLLVAAVCTVVMAILIDRTVVGPVNKISAATASYIENKNEKATGEESTIAKLTIQSDDEVGVLCNSIKKMEADINAYIDNLTAVTAEKERIGAELGVATQIQASMLPCIFPAFPDRPEIDIYASMRPAKEVGGDFYDFFWVDDDHLALVMADVSGKGVPAALFMVIAKTLLKNVSQTGLSPKAVLEKVNNQLCVGNDAEMFVTVWLGILDISTGNMICSNAGHEYPALKRADGPYELIRDKHGFVLAGMENSHYTEYELQLNPGDKLFLYTDGVAEATDADEELYGTDRMLAALNQSAEADCETLLHAMQADIDAFVAEAPQFDDITMLSLELMSKSEFAMKKIKLPPTLEAIDQVTNFVEQELGRAGVPTQVIMQMNIAVDEICSNIARYSDASDSTVGVCAANGLVTLRFSDNGMPYDPTKQSDPDITLPAEERELGGLGIYMVKKSMDNVAYQYHDGFNLLTLTKHY